MKAIYRHREWEAEWNTIAIAEVSSDNTGGASVAVAGNLPEGEDVTGDQTLKITIRDILVLYGIVTEDTASLHFLKNPKDPKTPENPKGKGHMQRHAEMQLTR